MEVTDAGIEIELNRLLANASSPIAVSEVESVNEVTPLIQNEQKPMVVTELGIVNEPSRLA